MQKPISIRTKSEPAVAMQFLGWRNAWDLALWSDQVFFVPSGAENMFRTDSELDRSTGHVKEDAPAFLILGRADQHTRVDIGDWVVQDYMGVWRVVKNSTFQSLFEKVETNG